MLTLIADDDLTSRTVLLRMLEKHGHCNIVGDGAMAVETISQALKDGTHYDLICLDIMMPNLDGHAALAKIRELEEARGKGRATGKGSKIIMTTALSDYANVKHAYLQEADGYLVKPIDNEKLAKLLVELELIEQ